MVKKVISFTPRMVQMVEELRQSTGLMSFSATVHLAISQAYEKRNPAYAKSVANETPEERVKRRKEEQEVKESFVIEDLKEIARELDGKIVEELGNEFCVYYTYTGKKRFEQKVPLNMLSTDLVKTQYQPSKEKVVQLQKEGKVDY